MPTNLSKTSAGCEGANLTSLLQDCFACGVVAVDPQGKIVALTPAAEQILRPEASERASGSLTDLPASLQSIIREVRTSGAAVVDRQLTLYARSPAMPSLSATALPVGGPSSEPGIVLVLKDLSSPGRLGDHLLRLDRLASVGTLSASMAHEIKNALVPVRTFVDLLLEKHPETELADTVRRELHRVDTIVSSVLKFAAPAKPELCSARLHEILDHSLRLVQHRVEGRPIEFCRRFNVPSDAFRGDDRQLEQAFVNLFLNAVEAMGTEGSLTVTTEVAEADVLGEINEGIGSSKYLRIHIADTGAGISPENMIHIFEPFFTTKQNGTGLGLSVTRRIIEEHNGSIRAKSEPGRGTTFTVLLPAGPAVAGR